MAKEKGHQNERIKIQNRSIVGKIFMFLWIIGWNLIKPYQKCVPYAKFRAL
jgi:hypothetical protein